MPFISIKILKGHGKDKLDRISAGVTRVVSETTSIPAENIWVVLEEVEAERWYVQGKAVAQTIGT